MEQTIRYSAQDKMSSLISQNSALLQVMSCFNIPLGFADLTVEEVCIKNNVHTPTFLAVINFVADGFSSIDTDYKDLSIQALMCYLRQTHIYYLEHLLPGIRQKLVEAIGDTEDKLARLILRAFDEYTAEIDKHMNYEDQTVFVYVENLLSGKQAPHYQIKTYSKHHDLVGERLTELKNIIIRYTPSGVNNFLLTTALLDIYGCEKGLEWHCKIEDYLFSPLVDSYERKLQVNEK